MKMIRFYLQKLVRDKVVAKCLDDPEVLHTEYRELEGAEFRRELQRKIHEEADEIPLGDDDREESLKELADLQEVVDMLRQDFGFSLAEVQREMERKKQDKGGFEKRHYIEYNDIADGSKWIDMFRAQPEKYKEENHTGRIMTKPDIKGTYKHSKSGKLYDVIDVALHTETGEMMVAYRALYGHDELAEQYGKHPLFVRPYDMFFDTVEIDGEVVPRFEKMPEEGRTLHG